MPTIFEEHYLDSLEPIDIAGGIFFFFFTCFLTYFFFKNFCVVVVRDCLNPTEVLIGELENISRNWRELKDNHWIGSSNTASQRNRWLWRIRGNQPRGLAATSTVSNTIRQTSKLRRRRKIPSASRVTLTFFRHVFDIGKTHSLSSVLCLKFDLQRASATW